MEIESTSPFKRKTLKLFILRIVIDDCAKDSGEEFLYHDA